MFEEIFNWEVAHDFSQRFLAALAAESQRALRETKRNL